MRKTVSYDLVMREILLQHRFQMNSPPGLYPIQNTVCSCFCSPMLSRRTEDSDYEWWVNHVLAHAEGTTHPNEWRLTDDGWEEVR